MGSQAKARGLVDELGGLDVAIDLVKKKAGIASSEQLSLVVYPPRRSLLEVLMGRAPDSMSESRLKQVFGRAPFQAWIQGGFLRMIPYWVEVR